MKVMGLVGQSGVGKTTLLVGVVRELTGRGLRVSTIKHVHHEFDLDRPGKDSYRHREAGACEVAISSDKRWAVMHELRGAPEPEVDRLVRHMTPVDLVLIEGFKRHAHDKIELGRAVHSMPALWRSDPHIVAVACDVKPPDLRLPLLPLDEPLAVAEFILRHCGFAPAEAAAQ